MRQEAAKRSARTQDKQAASSLAAGGEKTSSKEGSTESEKDRPDFLSGSRV